MLLDDNKQLSPLQMSVITQLMGVYDPEIPANVYDLGLIYDIIEQGEGVVEVLMTLTAPNCPMVDEMVEEIRQKTMLVDGINEVKVTITFRPPWDVSRMSEEARLVLGWM